MDSPKIDLWGYWGQCRSLAWGKTTFASWPRFWQTFFTTAIAYGSQWNLGIRGWKVSVQIFLTIVGAYVVVLIGSFLINLLKAPAQMESDEKAKHATELKKVGDHEVDLKRQIQSLNEELTAAKTAPPDPIMERVKKSIAAFNDQEMIRGRS